ncbi:MAG: hypothetical protein A2Y62_15325 [Candidatus Fischerbacteria bacterium RBG_13_37_8]|uniref:Uncharacterized protein n=1 Tax=Candidatus Fischerbacteria bacterium RBG_13_37_8 TaxID=1817863 RepID=A0A1F5VL01_9BACT|nr:MAG: hypothetical protein A2Y62_15325 [Candidatus Fischerbacteria bacterium RBG_13_37_8]
MGTGEWGLGTGDWGLGTGDWGLGTGEWGPAKNFQLNIPKKEEFRTTETCCLLEHQRNIRKEYNHNTFHSHFSRLEQNILCGSPFPSPQSPVPIPLPTVP